LKHSCRLLPDRDDSTGSVIGRNRRRWPTCTGPVANQAVILSNQETIQDNQDRIFSDLKEIPDNQRTILGNHAWILQKSIAVIEFRQ